MGLFTAIIIYISIRIRQTTNPDPPKYFWANILISTTIAIAGTLLIFILLEPLIIFTISLGILILMPFIARGLAIITGDLVRWYNWRKKQTSLTEQIFLANLAQFHSRFAIKYTKKVREQNMLVANKHNDQLEGLVIAYETSKRNKEDTPKSELAPTHSDPFLEWLAAYTHKNENRLTTLGPEFFDEICRLIEQTKSNQQQTSPPLATTDS